MQNENAGKAIEQIAAEKHPSKIDAAIFLNGVAYAQQSQPMWREIEEDRVYEYLVVRPEMGSISQFDYVTGAFLIGLGYTHYLSSEELLRLPIAQSK